MYEPIQTFHFGCKLSELSIFFLDNPTISTTSLSSPAAVVRYITTYSQGNAVKQAVLFPVVKVATSENSTSAVGERFVAKTLPTVSVLNNGTSFVTNGRSVQPPTYVSTANLLQQVSENYLCGHFALYG